MPSICEPGWVFGFPGHLALGLKELKLEEAAVVAEHKGIYLKGCTNSRGPLEIEPGIQPDSSSFNRVTVRESGRKLAKTSRYFGFNSRRENGNLI